MLTGHTENNGRVGREKKNLLPLRLCACSLSLYSIPYVQLKKVLSVDRCIIRFTQLFY